jgi:hypothetical protein
MVDIPSADCCMNSYRLRWPVAASAVISRPASQQYQHNAAELFAAAMASVSNRAHVQLNRRTGTLRLLHSRDHTRAQVAGIVLPRSDPTHALVRLPHSQASLSRFQATANIPPPPAKLP